ncbi:hypothetical protein Ciccas_011410 [Cichlidogyrus casuarinus]|uniref:Uncharacterized protein n=1 Tax=Cichlidogyrus casuarinus TaxID=1844966 RepID=A0ABD2PU91_9PLAT
MDNTRMDNDTDGKLEQDMKALDEAYQLMDFVLKHINKTAQIRQIGNDLDWLQQKLRFVNIDFKAKTAWNSNRCLIQAGPVNCLRYNNKSTGSYQKREMIMFLFTDCFLVATPTWPSSIQDSTKAKAPKSGSVLKFNSKRIFAPYLEESHVPDGIAVRTAPPPPVGLESELIKKVSKLQQSQQENYRDKVAFVSQNLRVFIAGSSEKTSGNTRFELIPFGEPIWIRNASLKKIKMFGSDDDATGPSDQEFDSYARRSSLSMPHLSNPYQSIRRQSILNLPKISNLDSDLKLYTKQGGKTLKLRFGNEEDK